MVHVEYTLHHITFETKSRLWTATVSSWFLEKCQKWPWNILRVNLNAECRIPAEIFSYFLILLPRKNNFSVKYSYFLIYRINVLWNEKVSIWAIFQPSDSYKLDSDVKYSRRCFSTVWLRNDDLTLGW